MTQRSGFTLVELSIVLVIIGLLIGGILVGQSLISSAKTQRLIRTMEQYLIAARNFKTTYEYWPGDYPRNDFGCAGNGDSIVQFTGGGSCPNPDGTANTEGVNFFVQLSKAGFLPQKLDYTTSGAAVGGTAVIPDQNVPSGPDKGSTLIIKDVVADSGQTAVFINNFAWGLAISAAQPVGTQFLMYHRFAVTAASCLNSDLIQGGILTPSDSLAVDLKMDDGLPNTGDVIGTTGCDVPTTCGQGQSSGIYDLYQYSTTAPYNTSISSANCVVGFKLTD